VGKTISEYEGALTNLSGHHIRILCENKEKYMQKINPSIIKMFWEVCLERFTLERGTLLFGGHY